MKAAHDREEMIEFASLDQFRRPLRRHPQLDLRIEKLKSAGHDADDGIFGPVEHQVLANRFRIRGETAHPESITQNDRQRLPRASIVVAEGAARGRRYTQQPEQIGRDGVGLQVLGLTAAGKIDRTVAHRRHVFEDVVSLLPLLEYPWIAVVARESECGVVLPDRHEPRWIPIRERAKKRGIRDAEDRGRRADAERERAARKQRETWRLREYARGMADIQC